METYVDTPTNEIRRPSPASFEEVASRANITLEQAMHIRKKIKHVLHYYPGLNLSMLQVGLGITIKAPAWKPVYFWMRENGMVREDNVHAVNVAGQHHTYTKIYLVPGNDNGDEEPLAA